MENRLEEVAGILKALEANRKIKSIKGIKIWLDKSLEEGSLQTLIRASYALEAFTEEALRHCLDYYIHYGIFPKCKTCATDIVKLRVSFQTKKLNLYCSNKCLKSSPESKAQIKATLLEKYGIANISQISSIKEKKKETMLRNYGVDNPSRSEEIQARKIQTSLKNWGTKSHMQTERGRLRCKEGMERKHGVSHNSQMESVKRSKIESSLEKYGVSCPLVSSEIKDKFRSSSLHKYSVDNPFKSEVVKRQISETNINKYGDSVPSRTEAIKEKVRNTCLQRYSVENAMKNKALFSKNQRSSFQTKDYQLGNSLVKVRGYEPYCLDFLTKYLHPDLLEVDPTKIPSVIYVQEGKTRTYYPDIFIESLNTIIEVKSTYTVQKDPERIELKKQAVLKEGYKYFLIVVDAKQTILETEDFLLLTDLLQQRTDL